MGAWPRVGLEVGGRRVWWDTCSARVSAKNQVKPKEPRLKRGDPHIWVKKRAYGKGEPV